MITTNEVRNISQEIYVSRIHHHPDFDRSSQGYEKGSDLALLELAYAPMTDNHTRPVCLGNAKSYQDIIDKGEMAECYITGFGKQETEFFQGNPLSSPSFVEHVFFNYYSPSGFQGLDYRLIPGPSVRPSESG